MANLCLMLASSHLVLWKRMDDLVVNEQAIDVQQFLTAESVGSNSTALRPSAYFTPASSAPLNNSASCFSFFIPGSSCSPKIAFLASAMMSCIAAASEPAPVAAVPVRDSGTQRLGAVVGEVFIYNENVFLDLGSPGG